MRWVFRFRVYIIIILAVMLISAAVIFSVLRAVLPYATGYKNEIQQEISRQIGLPVEIDAIDAAIHWFSPRLKLIDVTIFDEKNKVPLFNFKEAFVELDVIASILHGEFIVNDVGLVGADISIEKLSANEWLVQGIKFTSEGSSELPDKFLYMLQNSDYLLHDSNIYYQDHTERKLNISLLDINIDVNNQFNNHDIKISIKLPEEYGHNLAIVANLFGDINSLGGDIYVEAHQLNIEQWNAKFGLVEEYQVGAVVDVDFWARLENSSIQTLFAQLASTDLSISNKATAKSWNTDYLSANMRYVLDEEHWNIAVSDFYFGKQGAPAWSRTVNIMASENDENYYLSADFLNVADIEGMLEVFLDHQALTDFNKFRTYKLQAGVYNLNLQLPKQMSRQQLYDQLKLDATVIDFSVDYPLSEKRIRLAGIDASLHYENRQAVLDLMSQDAEVEITKLFRGPLSAEIIQGQLTMDYDGSNWQLKSNQLQVKNNHVNTFSRLAMQLSAEDNIFIDLQTDFYDAYGKYAHHYLPVGIMGAGLVNWLDMAVTSGYVPSGSLILHGHLSDFPYRDHRGVFQVLFPLRDASMKFLKQWPLLNEASATVKFNNLSLLVNNAKARTLDASVFDGFVKIIDLTKPHLTISTSAHALNEDIQSYIWNSPLDNVLGNAMRQFQLGGASDLNLKIEVPLNDKGLNFEIDGHLNLIDAEMYYPVLGYELTDINGVIDFTKDSVFADSVKAKVQNKTVDINAFTRNGDSGSEVVFHLDGILGADYLLQQYEWIPEDWLSGNSMWSVDFSIPYQAKDYLLTINANSLLEGVVVQMSDKVNKRPGARTRVAAEINVLSNNGLHVVVSANDDNILPKKTAGTRDAAATENGIKSNDIFQLYGVRDENKVWDLNIFSDYVTGKGEFTEGLAKEKQVILDLESIDLHALFVTDNKGKSRAIKPGDLPPFNWKIKKVLWDESVFTDVQVETSWHKHGMLINTLSLKGPGMNFDADGTWLTSWRGLHETVLRGTVSGSNLGESLTGLGFQRSLDRCEYKASFNAKWSAEPYKLSWDNVKGDASFEMFDGEIVEVDPGAGGRLLGLLNIFKLTNRLVFDFDDVVRKGFSFDSIKGTFEFDKGYGSLKSFDVLAPAADISMFGGIGLLTRDYELLMTVKPHTDSLTFASGTLLGGVVIGAGLALIQKVFDLGFIGHNVYSITGSWDDPAVEKIIKRKAEPRSPITDEDDF